MPTNFDPRAWNLVTGVVLLVAGCGPRVAGETGGETGDPAPECVNHSDCPPDYSCFAGMCGWNPPPDDEWEETSDHECDYDDGGCAEFEICESYACVMMDAPPPPCDDGVFSLPVPVAVPGQALALTFADVDADGQDELVIATEAELVVYEPGGAAPTISDREAGLIEDMVAGSFDPTPGEDALLLVADSLLLHGSNGDGSFAPGVVSPTAIGSISGLYAGQFDDQPPTDLFAWGGAGAYVERAGQVMTFGNLGVLDGAAHEFGSSSPGFALMRDHYAEIYTPDGQLVVGWYDTEYPWVIAAFTHGPEALYVHVDHRLTWSRVLAGNPNEETRVWAIYGTPDQIAAGDLDGNGTDELVLFDDASVAIDVNPLAEGNCWYSPYSLIMPARGNPSEAVFGDHDGDGDEELAVRTSLGEVVLIDGG
jgi:hypothetical protein